MSYSSGINILSVLENVESNSDITYYNLHTYHPYASSSFGPNDQIIIGVNSKNDYTHPHESYLQITGKINGYKTEDHFLGNNALPFLFSNMEYYINGVEVDRVTDIGITSTIKTLLSATEANKTFFSSMGFDVLCDDGGKSSHTHILNDKGHFSIMIPMKHLMGFFSDFKKVLLNVKQELRIRRDREDKNSLKHLKEASTAANIEIVDINWKLPIVKFSDKAKLNLLNYLKNNSALNVVFRQYQLYTYPDIPQSKDHIWNLKMTIANDRPIYIILALQTEKQQNTRKDVCSFDHCSLREFRVFINNSFTPYESQNLDFANNNFTAAYHDFVKFLPSFDGSLQPKSAISPARFKSKYPLFVVNLTNRDEDLTNSGVADIKIEFKLNENAPIKTTCYALLINERFFKYTTMTDNVVKIL